MLNNITIKVPGETVATLTAPQCDIIVNKTFCFLFVGDFVLFSFVFQHCLSQWRTGMDADWKKGMDCADYSAFTVRFLDPFFALIFAAELDHLISLALWHFVGFNQ